MTLLLLQGLLLAGTSGRACTNYLITRGASADGSNMITYAADSHVLYGELYYWQASSWPQGAMLDVYEWDTGKYLGKIRQAPQTYTVVGNMNEFQVTIGETTYGGRDTLINPQGIIDYGSLIYITLQRARTAREAIRIMHELVEEYGYYSSGESFSIADKNEVWIMEMIGKGPGIKGANWVALRIPDGCVSGHANQARITTFPFQKVNRWDDPAADCFHSPDVFEFARAHKFIPENLSKAEFSFSDTYAPVDFSGARFCEIRVWTMFNKVASGMDKYWEYAKGHVIHDAKTGYATNRMPLWIKPDRKISLHEVMNFMRDHLEGTELDMHNDPGAGAFGCPYRWRPLTWKSNGLTYCNERATATQQTGFSFVAQCRASLPDPIGGIFWFGTDDAANSVYAPMYCGIRAVPKTFARGNGAMMQWSENAAFWVFSQVTHLAYLRYDLIHHEIDSLQQLLEKKYIAYTPAVDQAAAELYKANPQLALSFLTDYSVNTGDALVARWKEFYQYLFMKYMDGNVKWPNPGEQNPHLSQPGYPQEWYDQIARETGDKLKVQGSAH